MIWTVDYVQRVKKKNKPLTSTLIGSTDSGIIIA